MPQQTRYQISNSNIIPLPQPQRAAPDAPYSQEAEEALLGSCLIDPKAYVRARTIIQDNDFFFLRHMYIWQAMTAIFDRHEPVNDLVILNKQLEDHGRLKDVGGIAFLTQLVSATATSVHAEVYAQIVQRCACRRRLLQAGDTIKALGLDETISVEAAREQAIAALLNTPDVSTNSIQPLAESINRHFDRVEQAINNPQTAATGFPTGLRDLDSLLDGLHRRKLYVVAGINHHGKTSLMMTMALNAARAGARVAYFNVADGDETDVTSRMIAMESGLPVHKVTTGVLNPGEYSRYVETAGRVSKLPIYLHCKKGMSPRQIYDQANQIKHLYGGLDVVVIDYIQRITLGENAVRFKSQYDQLTYISQQMTILADEKHLNCAMVVGAQINRGGAKRSNKPPTRYDIEGCGKIEQDADVVLINWYEAVDNKEFFHEDLVKVIVEKNKVTGQLGAAWTRIDKISTRLTDWESKKAHKENIP